jgi:bifunctional polynucleotide phosphatase/kinase
LDFTLISTKSGKKFPNNPEDWKFLYPQTVECLKKFFTEHEDFKFVIFTNQAGASDVVQQEQMKKKLENITKQINIPALVFMATQKNKYRKPMTGGWDILVRDYNGGVEPNLQTSFYCGDAAGRKKDFAMSDRLFALNIGLTFKLPEQFFLGSTRLEEMNMPVFDPKKYMAQSSNNDRVKFPQSQEV